MMLILDMDMPNVCCDCPMCYDYMYCQAACRSFEEIDCVEERADWCPLIEQKIGKWLHTPTYWYYCSVCGSFPPNETNVKTPYCPYCGAKMTMEEVEGEE